MFLKDVDCEGEVKDGPFIANILIQAIEQVGPQNVVQVILDNAENCRAAGLLVEERFEHSVWTPCAVHALKLMLQKIGTKFEWINKVYEDAQEIQMFRQFSKLELLKVASSSSSERNWSTYSIPSIKCNRLHSKKAEDLVFVHSNLRLLTHKDNAYKKGEAKHWNVEPERAELADLIAHFDVLAVDDDHHELPSDVEAAPEADIANTDASSTFCASNFKQHNDNDNDNNDNDLFDGFL